MARALQACPLLPEEEEVWLLRSLPLLPVREKIKVLLLKEAAATLMPNWVGVVVARLCQIRTLLGEEEVVVVVAMAVVITVVVVTVE